MSRPCGASARSTRARSELGRSGRRARLARLDRDLEPEGGAPAQLAVHADRAAVRRHDLLGDEQAEAGAARRLLLAARELLEDASLLLGGDAGAGVAHLEANPALRGQ